MVLSGTVSASSVTVKALRNNDSKYKLNLNKIQSRKDGDIENC